MRFLGCMIQVCMFACLYFVAVEALNWKAGATYSDCMIVAWNCWFLLEMFEAGMVRENCKKEKVQTKRESCFFLTWRWGEIDKPFCGCFMACHTEMYAYNLNICMYVTYQWCPKSWTCGCKKIFLTILKWH